MHPRGQIDWHSHFRRQPSCSNSSEVFRLAKALSFQHLLEQVFTLVFDDEDNGFRPFCGRFDMSATYAGRMLLPPDNAPSNQLTIALTGASQGVRFSVWSDATGSSTVGSETRV